VANFSGQDGAQPVSPTITDEISYELNEDYEDLSEHLEHSDAESGQYIHKWLEWNCYDDSFQWPKLVI
jgi:hypothetical protein